MDTDATSEIYLFADWLERHGLLVAAHAGGHVRGGMTASTIARVYINNQGRDVEFDNGRVVVNKDPLSTWPTPKSPVKGVEL